MIVTEETKTHAQAILDYIMLNPEKHDQAHWVIVDGLAPVIPVVTEENFCGTTMCIAGTSQFITGGIEGLNIPLYRISEEAQGRLGLESETEANKLFMTMNESKAVDMLRAIANGDADKFNHIYETVPDED